MLKPALVFQNYFTNHGNRNQILKKLNKIVTICLVMLVIFYDVQVFCFLFLHRMFVQYIGIGCFFLKISQNIW